MKRIKLLPNNLINQIAAGEVIERPASIVKELLENSIDAGATRIEIEINNDCRNIRVADNGNGIHKDDVALAFSRHATSKIQDESDLWGISTLGFRGEALASIISVAKVICITRTPEVETGIKAECQNSEIKITNTGCAIGTTMEIKDLFYNVPARAKFMKKSQTELAYIIETVQGIAISYPEVAINVINKGHSSLKTTGSGDLATVISEIYSKELIRELSEVNFSDSGFGLEIKGYASNPDFTRSNKKAVYLFINGRTVRCPILSKAVDTAYKDLIPSGRYPFAVLDLKIPAGEVDVNVHPAKREVRYTNPNQIFNFTFSAVKSALEVKLFSSSASFEPRQEGSYATATPIAPKSSYQPLSSKIDFSRFKEQTVERSIDFYAPQKQEKIEFTDFAIEEKIEKPQIIGQFLNTYILIEHSDGLQMIDQHIAHERINYEKLKAQKDVASQLVLASPSIELEPTKVSLIEENLETLAKFGYEFEIIDEKHIALKQIPQIIAKRSPESVVFELIEALENSSIESIEDEILITTACHASVKANEKLSIWQMDELITEWQKTKQPWTCPHGRVISKILPVKEIANFFSRQI